MTADLSYSSYQPPFYATAFARLQPEPSNLNLQSDSSTDHFVPNYSIRSTAKSVLCHFNILKTTREISQAIGEFSKFYHSSDKSNSVTISFFAQSRLILNIQSLLNEPVKVEYHPSTNHSQGIITILILIHMKQEDILEGLTSQKVTKSQ